MFAIDRNVMEIHESSLLSVYFSFYYRHHYVQEVQCIDLNFETKKNWYIFYWISLECGCLQYDSILDFDNL